MFYVSMILVFIAQIVRFCCHIACSIINRMNNFFYFDHARRSRQ